MTVVSADMRVVVVEDHVLFAESLSLALGLEGHVVRRPAVRPRATAHRPGRRRAQGAAGRRDHGPRPGHRRQRCRPRRPPHGGRRRRPRRDRLSRSGGVGPVPARRGAGVVAKQAPLAEILAAVRRLATGQLAMPRRRREQLIAAWREEQEQTASARQRIARLTPRERAVLDELADGRRIHDIATADVVSQATVRTQVKSILSKLEVRSQLAAVLLLHDHRPGRRLTAPAPRRRLRRPRGQPRRGVPPGPAGPGGRGAPSACRSPSCRAW